MAEPVLPDWLLDEPACAWLFDDACCGAFVWPGAVPELPGDCDGCVAVAGCCCAWPGGTCPCAGADCGAGPFPFPLPPALLLPGSPAARAGSASAIVAASAAADPALVKYAIAYLLPLGGDGLPVSLPRHRHSPAISMRR